jgi:NADH-quinone oxidoreductase subunit L
VFSGHARSEAAEHAHENSGVMTVPLILLAIGAIALGFLGTPAWPWLQSALSGQPVEAHSLTEGASLMALSIVLVAFGIGAGWALYRRQPRTTESAPDPLARSLPGVFAVLAARLGFDEFYAATLGKLNTALATLSDFFDRWVWDGIIRFLAMLGEVAGIMTREADEDGINAGFDATSRGLRGAGRKYSALQTGRAQGYLRALALGFVVLVLIAFLGGRP